MSATPAQNSLQRHVVLLVVAAALSGCLTQHKPPAWYNKGHERHMHKPEVPPLPKAATATALSEGSTAVTGMMDPAAHPVPPPPFSEDIFPCSDCHEDEEVDTTPRKLTDEHEDIHIKHGPRERWCFDCHNPLDRDKLRLVSGALIDFKVSYRLCGQCHGPKLRDWRAGVHGKRTGQWNGTKQYLLCVHCHNPHAPRFKDLKPMAVPKRPSELH